MNDMVHDDSVVGIIPQLDLFTPPVLQSAVERSVIVEYRPTSQIGSESAPVHFSLGGDSRHYLDLQRTRLNVKLKLVREDGKPMEDDEKTAPVNLTLHSMWSQVDIQVSGKPVSSTNGYPYVAMIQTLLRNSAESKRSFLPAQMYFQDTGNIEEVMLNTGGVQRQIFFEKNSSVEMEGPLASDICSTNRYILCNTAIDIRLFRSRPEFLVITETENKYSAQIEDICLKAHYIEVSPGIISGHAAALQKAPAIYPFTRTELKTYTIPSGSRSFNFDNIFNSFCPEKVVAAFVASDAFSGNFKKNPFNFQHFDLTSIEVAVDGLPVPSRGLKCNFDKEGRQVAAAISRMYDSVGASNNPNFGNGIGLDEFVNGHALYCFTICGAGLEDNLMEVRRSANVSVQGSFDTPTKQSVTLILYSESPAIAEIEASRNIITH